MHTQGGTHKRRACGPPQESCYLRGHRPQAVHTEGGGTHKVETHKRRSVATAGVLLFKGPQARRYTQKAVHTQGENTHKAEHTKGGL